MGVYPIGDQRVGITVDLPVLDVNGDPTFTAFGEPITATSTVWVDDSCFEIQTPTETQNLTVTTSEIAWAMMPIVDGKLTAVDDDGDPAPLTMYDADGNAVLNSDGQLALNSGMQLRHNGLTYVMRGDAVLEQDIRGRQDHVFCVCERQKS